MKTMVWDFSDRESIVHYDMIHKEYASEYALNHGSREEEKE